MILIISVNNDFTTTHVMRWLRFLGKDFLRINEDDSTVIESVTENDFTLKVNNRVVHFSEISSVWYRRGNLFFNNVKEVEPTEKDNNILLYNKKENEDLSDYIHNLFKTKKFLNNYGLDADKIAEIYKNRWQIETMFKRLKQNFPLKYFLGDNQNAIEIQIWISLIIQLIMLVIQRKAKRNWAYSNMMSVIRYHLMTYIDLFKFLKNPEAKWEEITTKSLGQLSLFDP